MKLIPLNTIKKTKIHYEKLSTMVDDEDYDWLTQWNWSVSKNHRNIYVVRLHFINGKRNKKHMHREILNVKPDEFVDHIDHNSLNNQKSNLRIYSRSQNMANRTAVKNGYSKYLGVSWYKKSNKFIAMISKNKKFYYLGIFKNEIDAAKAYDKKAKELHGEFANLNFKDE